MGVGFNIPTDNYCFAGDGGVPPLSMPAVDREGPSNSDEFGRNHRFEIEFMAPISSQFVQGNGLLLNVEKCTRPTVEFDEIKIHNGQDEIYRPGKHHWSPIEFTFYERIAPSDDTGLIAGSGKPNQMAQAIYNWWAGASQFTMLDYKTSSLTAPGRFQVDCSVNMIDGLGRKNWTYILRECWPLKVYATDLNYSDTDLSKITVVLRYNRAEELQQS
jgi:hypothetical protein